MKCTAAVRGLIPWTSVLTSILVLVVHYLSFYRFNKNAIPDGCSTVLQVDGIGLDIIGKKGGKT